MSINYVFFANGTQVSSYGLWINGLIDSCYSGGVIGYDNVTRTLQLHIYSNVQTKYCQISMNELVSVQINVGSSSFYY